MDHKQKLLQLYNKSSDTAVQHSTNLIDLQTVSVARDKIFKYNPHR